MKARIYNAEEMVEVRFEDATIYIPKAKERDTVWLSRIIHEVLVTIKTSKYLNISVFKVMIVVPIDTQRFLAIAKAKDKEWFELLVDRRKVKMKKEIEFDGKTVNIENIHISSKKDLSDSKLASLISLVYNHALFNMTQARKVEVNAYYDIIIIIETENGNGFCKIGSEEYEVKRAIKTGRYGFYSTKEFTIVDDGEKIIKTQIIDEQDLEILAQEG